MAVEEVFVPVGAVGCVGKLGVETHYCGEDLGEEEDGEAGKKGGVEFRGPRRGFTLRTVLVICGCLGDN